MSDENHTYTTKKVYVLGTQDKLDPEYYEIYSGLTNTCTTIAYVCSEYTDDDNNSYSAVCSVICVSDKESGKILSMFS